MKGSGEGFEVGCGPKVLVDAELVDTPVPLLRQPGLTKAKQKTYVVVVAPFGGSLDTQTSGRDPDRVEAETLDIVEIVNDGTPIASAV